MRRCTWPGNDPLYCAYHDNEWGSPSFDDQHLFEMLVLEGSQAGLSWITILRKRENYRRAYDNFAAQKMVCYNANKIEQLLADPGIVRNKLKIHAAIANARAYLAVLETQDSFAKFIWQFTDGSPIDNHWRKHAEVPITTPQSDSMSKELKKRGFKFVGSTICYAYMQAIGMVNDHLVDCYRHKEISQVNKQYR